MEPWMGFRVGSNTKPYTATLLMMLWDEGLIDLDMPISVGSAPPPIDELDLLRCRDPQGLGPWQKIVLCLLCLDMPVVCMMNRPDVVFTIAIYQRLPDLHEQVGEHIAGRMPFR